MNKMKWKSARFFYLSLSVLLFGLFFVLVRPAAAAVVYERTPGGTEITSPVAFAVSVDDFDADIGPECNAGIDDNFWGVGVAEEDNLNRYASDFVASSSLSGNFSIALPVGYDAWDVFIQCSADGVSLDTQGAQLEGGGVGSVFIIVETSGVIVLPTSFAPELTANVSAQLANDGIVLLLAIAIGIPLVFYVLNELIGLIPKGRRGTIPSPYGKGR